MTKERDEFIERALRLTFEEDDRPVTDDAYSQAEQLIHAYEEVLRDQMLDWKVSSEQIEQARQLLVDAKDVLDFINRDNEDRREYVQLGP